MNEQDKMTALYQRIMGWSVPQAARLIQMPMPLATQAFYEMDDLLCAMIDLDMRKFQKISECQNNCPYCCYQPVVISPAEAFRIVRGLPPHATIQALDERGQMMHDKGWDAVAHDGMFRNSVSCILLRDRKCSVYKNRPTICRSYFSLSRRKCIIGWQSRFQEHIPEGDFIRESQDDALTMQIAFDYSFWRLGLQTEHWELSYALSVAARPGALWNWLVGQKVFDERQAVIYPNVDGTPRGPYSQLMEVTHRSVDFLDLEDLLR